MKALMIAIFPAPYRSELIFGLSKFFDVEVFFERNCDFGRDTNFFKTFDFDVLDKKENKKKLNHLLKNFKQFDFVFLYDFTSLLSMKIMLKCIKTKVPYFINCDGVILNKKKNYFHDAVKKYFVKKASICFGSGEKAKQYFTSLGAKEENVVLHHFSALHADDILSIPLTNVQKQIIRKKYSLPANKHLFIGVGRFIYLKNYHLLLQNIEKFGPDSFFVLVGGGPLLNYYNKIISEKEIKNVKLFGYMEPSSVYEIMSCCDIFIHPTSYDAWGLVINEALARGLPVLTSDTCVAGLELINNNGAIIKGNDFDEYCNSAYKILKNEDSYKKYSFNSIKTIREYTIEKMVIDQYEGICKFFNK